MQQTTDLTVRKTVIVEAPVDRAWQVFTDRISSWWPVATHSLGGEQVETVVVEGRPGGRLFERTADGGEADWADVVVWEPPRRLVLNWWVNPNNPATEVEVTFAPDGDGSTRVDLEHRGWEKLEERAADGVASYDSGWDAVLAPYVEAASEK